MSSFIRDLPFSGPAELKDYIYRLGPLAEQTELFLTVTKRIAMYVATQYGVVYERYVEEGIEPVFDEPVYPTGEDDTPENRARWAIQEKKHVDIVADYKVTKGKVFSIIKGQCHPTIQELFTYNQNYIQASAANNVTNLLKVIKSIMYHSSELVYGPRRSLAALRALITIQQKDGESLATYHARFQGVLELASRKFGYITPTTIAKGVDGYSAMSQEEKLEQHKKTRQAMEAYVFLASANSQIYGGLMANLHRDFSFKNDRYPADLESAMNALQVNTVMKQVKKKGARESSFAQMDAGKFCKRCGKKHATEGCVPFCSVVASGDALVVKATIPTDLMDPVSRVA